MTLGVLGRNAELAAKGRKIQMKVIFRNRKQRTLDSLAHLPRKVDSTVSSVKERETHTDTGAMDRHVRLDTVFTEAGWGGGISTKKTCKYTGMGKRPPYQPYASK